MIIEFIWWIDLSCCCTNISRRKRRKWCCLCHMETDMFYCWSFMLWCNYYSYCLVWRFSKKYNFMIKILSLLSIRSIRHLEQSAKTDGKAQTSLDKLKIFRQFYVMVNIRWNIISFLFFLINSFEFFFYKDRVLYLFNSYCCLYN